MVFCEGLFYLIVLGFRPATHEPGQDPHGLLSFSRRHKKARTFRNEQQGEEEGNGRCEFHPEHPAPGFVSQREDIQRAAGGPCDQVIAEEGHEEAADDGNLLNRGEPASVFRGGDFTDIGGGEHRRSSNSEPPEQSINDEFQRSIGDS